MITRCSPKKRLDNRAPCPKEDAKQNELNRGFSATPGPKGDVLDPRELGAPSVCFGEYIGDLFPEGRENAGINRQLFHNSNDVRVEHGGLAADRLRRSSKTVSAPVTGTQPTSATHPCDHPIHDDSFIILQPGSDRWNKKKQNGKLTARQNSGQKLRRKRISAIGPCLCCAKRKKQCNEYTPCGECETKDWGCIRGPQDIWLWKTLSPISFEKADDVSQIELQKKEHLEAARQATCSECRKLFDSLRILDAPSTSGVGKFTVKSRNANNKSNVANEFTCDLERLRASLADPTSSGLMEMEKCFTSHTNSWASQSTSSVTAQNKTQEDMMSLQSTHAVLSALMSSTVRCRPGHQQFARSITSMLVMYFLKRLTIAAELVSESIVSALKKNDKDDQLTNIRQQICLYYRIICETQELIQIAKSLDGVQTLFHERLATTRRNLAKLFDLAERSKQHSKNKCARVAKACLRKLASPSQSRQSSKVFDEKDTIDEYIAAHLLEKPTARTLDIAIFPSPSSTQLGDQAFSHDPIQMATLLGGGELISDSLRNLPGSDSTAKGFRAAEVSSTVNPNSPLSLAELQRVTRTLSEGHLRKFQKSQSAISFSQENTIVESTSHESQTILDEPLSAEPESEPEHGTDNLPVLRGEFGEPLSPGTKELGISIWKHPWNGRKEDLEPRPKREYTSGSESSAKLSQRFLRNKRVHIAADLYNNLARPGVLR